MAALGAMLAENVSLHSDGGGKRSAALRLLFGRAFVLQVFGALARRYQAGGSDLLRAALVNGLPGFVTREADGMIQKTARAIEEDRVLGIYMMRNPGKLKHLQ